MGVLPLQLPAGQSWESLGLTGRETFDIGATEDLKPLGQVAVTVTDDQGHVKTLETTVRIDTPVELEYYRNGGILQTVLRMLARQG
jgi:aconitate hydratase